MVNKSAPEKNENRDGNGKKNILRKLAFNFTGTVAIL